MSDTLFYKRATFVGHLPVGHRYTSSHTWLAPAPHHPDTWHVGLTKFALRMLGELVEHRLETPPGHPVQPGDILGSIEGFKAISDLFCVASGTFLGGNPALANGLEPLGRDVHRVWLYAVRGTPDPRSLDLHGYVGVLDATIDRILEKQAAEDADETASGAACPLPPHA